MKVGVVLFDSSQNIIGADRTIVSLDSAWSSVGGEPAKRVQSIHDLASDIIWLTNLNYSSFWKARLNGHPNFKDDKWMRTSVAQLSTELGIDTEHVTNTEMVETLSAIASRVGECVTRDYGVRVRGNALNQDMAEAINAPRSSISDEYYPLFEPVAEHPWVKVIQTTAYTANSPTLTVRTNRLEHARYVLSTPVPPDSGWVHVNNLPADPDAWLLSVGTSFLVRCTLRNVNEQLAEVLSWGSGSKATRDWLTDIEWRVVRGFADITVHDVLICDMPSRPVEQMSILPKGAWSELSVTYGLVAEQLWTAMALKRPYRGEQKRFTAAAAWLRAADRMRMFDFAQKLYSAGIDVSGYGTGAVFIRYPENGLTKAVDASLRVGLTPPGKVFATKPRAKHEFTTA